MSIERRESLSQRDNPTVQAREQLKQLLRLAEPAHGERIANMFGRYDVLSQAEKARIAPSIVETSNMASGADQAIRARMQREYIEVAHAKQDQFSAAKSLWELDFA